MHLHCNLDGRVAGWSRLVMVSRRIVDQRFVFCDYAARSIELQVRAHTNMTLEDWIRIDDGLADEAILKVLERIRTRGRSECLGNQH